MWTTPRRKPFNPSGIALGANVISDSRISGQIWAPAPTRTYGKHWWVVDSDGVPHECWERDLVVLDQCNDVPLLNINAA